MTSSKAINETTLRILKECGIDKPPVPIERIVDYLSIRLQKAPLPDELSGLLYRQGGSEKPIIGVNSQHPPVRQRFTIAHEIGHYYLHKKSDVHIDRAFSLRFRRKKSYSSMEGDEIEANQFAADLLMPAEFLKRELGNRVIDLADEDILTNLAERYRVSLQAMVYRLLNLGYLSY